MVPAGGTNDKSWLPRKKYAGAFAFLLHRIVRQGWSRQPAAIGQIGYRQGESKMHMVEERAAAGTESWPADVDFIVSALEAGSADKTFDKRRAVRVPYRSVGFLKLYSEPDAKPVTIYSRDVCCKSLGFVTRTRLPLGYGGILTLKGPDGQELRLDVTLLRCREAVPGWYEGALYFNRPQQDFSRWEMTQK